jgi:hypothetical protein
MKKIYLAISLAVCLASAPLTTYAQAKKAKSAAVTMNETQKEKQQFAYGFYKTYMNSLIYQLSDLYMVIAKKFVSPKVLKKTADTGADVLLDAQDCIEENVRTLQVVPINNDWFCVTFMWTSTYDKIPSQKKVIYIKVKQQGNSFIIEDATSEKPKLTKI